MNVVVVGMEDRSNDLFQNSQQLEGVRCRNENLLRCKFKPSCQQCADSRDFVQAVEATHILEARPNPEAKPDGSMKQNEIDQSTLRGEGEGIATYSPKRLRRSFACQHQHKELCRFPHLSSSVHRKEFAITSEEAQS